MTPWFGIIIVLGCLGGLLLVCQFTVSHFSLSPELSRKSIHIGMGIICSCFPLLFTEIWPVFLLASVAVLSLVAVRSNPALRTSIGSSLHRIKRFSLGEIYFPLAVAIVWFISIDTPLYYSMSILVLTLADALAALIGTKYGQKHYSTKEGHKTCEGSFSFFIVTFLCIQIPLLLLTNIGRAECILIALLIGTIVMILEAVAWCGLDNLLIPLSVCLLLNIYDNYGAEQVLGRLLLVWGIVMILFAVRRQLKLDGASLLGASLCIYLVSIVGGWEWALAPVALFFNYLMLGSQKTCSDEHHNIYSLLAVAVPGFVWLVLFNSHENDIYLVCFTFAYMAELICIYIAQWAFLYSKQSLLKISLASACVGFTMIMLPYVIFVARPFSWKLFLVGLAVAILSSQMFRFLQPQIRNCPLTIRRWLFQGFIGLLASLIPWVIITKVYV
jgi:phytol kinase